MPAQSEKPFRSTSRGAVGYENYKKIKEWVEKKVEETAKTIKEVYPEAEVYLVGSVAEGTFTARSDIDLLLVFPERPKARHLIPVLRALLDKGILPEYPLQFHLGDKEKLKEYKRLGKAVRLDEAVRAGGGNAEGREA